MDTEDSCVINWNLTWVPNFTKLLTTCGGRKWLGLSEKSKVKYWWDFIGGVIFHPSQGLRNDLKAALDKIDQQYLNELVGGQEPGEEDTQNDLKVHEENTTIEELEVISTPTCLHSLAYLPFPGEDSWGHRVAHFGAQRHKGPFEISCFYLSLPFSSMSTHIILLPAFKSNHLAMFDTHPCICWWSCKASSVLYACVLNTHKWYYTVKLIFFYSSFST